MSKEEEAGTTTLDTRILSGSSVLRIKRDKGGKVQEAFIHTPYVARGFPTEDLKMARQLLETGGKEQIAASL